MRQAKTGDSVHVHYTGTFDDGTVFDTSEEGDPIQFTIGSGDVIAGFEESVLGMECGQTKRERFSAERAYGERSDDMIFTVEREQVPEADQLQVGDVVNIEFSDGSSAPVHVAVIGEQTITFDANHPLAGKPLTFDLTLVSID